jgi:hypothetical protein
MEINIWDTKFSDLLDEFITSDEEIISINCEDIKQTDEKCQDNLQLLNALPTNVIVNLTSCYGSGVINISKLKQTRCQIYLFNLNIVVDLDDTNIRTNIVCYPMEDNNCYLCDEIRRYCDSVGIPVIRRI